MAFTLVSTTEERPALEQAAGNEWKTPPAQTEKPRDPGDVPADIPQKLFNEIREEQIAAKKKAGPALFEGEAKKDVESPIKNYERAKERDRAAEAHKRELRSILDGVSGERASGESQSSSESQSNSESQPSAGQNGNGEYERHWQAAAASYPDFEETMAAGVGMSKKLEAAIRAIGNAGEIAHIAYGLSKNTELLAEVERDPSQLARISPTVHHNQLFDDHRKRLSAHYAEHPEDQKAIAAAISSGLDISKPAYDAILEQPNSEQVLKYLVVEKPDKLAELNRLYPTAAIAEVGKISDRLEAKAAAKEKYRPPAPISPVTSSGTRMGSSLEKMDIHSFMRERNRQEREYKRRGR